MNKRANEDIWPIAAAVLAVLIALVLTAACMLYAHPAQEQKQPACLSTDYIQRLFDDSYVHEIDLQMPQVNWDYMVRFAEEEQYVLCDLVIDGEKVENAAIRPKGNSSLSAIKTRGDDHFSFKIEFDHYTDGNTWYGLDKLSLNNLGQDVSCMKDYLTYHMMNEIGVPAPLSSYVHLKLNGESFGLYLAVEAVEDSFALRNYGDDFGNIYKPECFAMDGLSDVFSSEGNIEQEQLDYSKLGPGDRVDQLGSAIRIPFETAGGTDMAAAALKYVGDDPNLYQVFFDSAVFDITPADRESLIQAIRMLNENPKEVVDYNRVIPYFVVHNFVDNYDGYTGIFDHNYYLREANGKISMIPWDYNLAFGVFTIESAGGSLLGTNYGGHMDKLFGNAMDDKTNMVNYPIDTPTFTVSTEDRPLLAAILNDPEVLERYHEVFRAFLDDLFASGKFESIYTQAWNNIAPYIENGRTFYTYDQFVTASKAIHDFCILRSESVCRQLDGTLECVILAPTTMAVSQKNKVRKNDLEDARRIARCLCFGQYSKVYVPTDEDNAVKEYIRMRDDAQTALKQTKHQIIALCTRHGYHFDGKSHWTQKHIHWLEALCLPNPLLQETLEEYLVTFRYLADKVERFDKRIQELSMGERYPL